MYTPAQSDHAVALNLDFLVVHGDTARASSFRSSEGSRTGAVVTPFPVVRL